MKKHIRDVPTLEVLKYQKEWCDNRDLPFTYERFPDFDEKLVYKKMEKLSDEGYLEYGVSLRTAWLTQKALDLIKEPSSA